MSMKKGHDGNLLGKFFSVATPDLEGLEVLLPVSLLLQMLLDKLLQVQRPQHHPFLEQANNKFN